MEHIYKRIAIEDLQTKYPLIYPAIKEGKLSLVSSSSLKNLPNANYRSMPYGINEEICGDFSNFTIKMGKCYSGKTIHYSTLEIWYKDFISYYNILYHTNCGIVYANASDYYDNLTNHLIDEKVKYKNLDEIFEERGGHKFYEWLNDNYFGILDLKTYYDKCFKDKIVQPLSKTLNEWLVSISGIKNTILSFAEVNILFSRLDKLYKKYGFVSPKKQTEDYFEYLNLGGSDTYLVIKNWLLEQNNKVESINSKFQNESLRKNLENSFTIQIPLKRKIENLGDYSKFYKEYNPQEDYSIGNICEYSGNPYIRVSNEQDGEIITINGHKWQKYSTYIALNDQEAFINVISGQTDSSLDNFISRINTTDAIGYELPGLYKPHNGSTVPAPYQGYELDIKYELGKTVNVTKLENNLFCGDLLYYIELYYIRSNGSIIRQRVFEGDNFNEKVNDLKIEVSQVNDLIDILYADFVYFKNTLFRYGDGKSVPVMEASTNDVTYHYGVKCIDHCFLTLETCYYHLTPDNSYPLYYYKVNKNIKSLYSDSKGGYNDVAVCDYYICTHLYQNNNNIIYPTYREESLLDYSIPENTIDTIYLDRGYSTVLDKHLRLGEITSYEELSRYGNGSFNLILLE